MKLNEINTTVVNCTQIGSCHVSQFCWKSSFLFWIEMTILGGSKWEYPGCNWVHGPPLEACDFLLQTWRWQWNHMTKEWHWHFLGLLGVPSGAGSVWSFGSTKQSPDGEVLCVGAHLLFPLYVAEAYEGSILGDLSSLYSASVWCLTYSFGAWYGWCIGMLRHALVTKPMAILW